MKLLVYGSKDFARIVRALLLHCGDEFVGFIDDRSPNDADVVGTYAEALRKFPPGGNIGMAIAIGYNHLEARHSAWKRAREDGYQTPSLVHRTAIVASSAKIGEGSIVMAGANVDVFADIGEICVLWPGAIVSHDSRLGANCFLSPGTIVCGFAAIGKSCFLGAGSVVVDHRTVGDGSFVKAGTVYK